ncbi:MAG: 1-acyl-sn-glycerol-3-phosphate acyltransferase [Sphingobacteriaceae bacterium]
MIIKSKPLPFFVYKWGVLFFGWFFKSRYNKIVINQATVKPQNSYLLMCNHFSFWDGFLAAYLALHGIHKQQPMKALYIMSLKKQMQKNWFLKYLGSFSIAPGARSMAESLRYAAEILNTPGNILLFYPQGNLESNYVRHIEFKEGLSKLVPQIKGDCQLIWSSNLVEYFESFKPTIYFNMLDCGNNHDFDFTKVQENVNKFHLACIQKNIRFTVEPE